MSYDPHDAAMDDFYDKVADELYPRHKEQAIQEFTADRLRSLYTAHPEVMVPAVLAYREAKTLGVANHHAVAVVFCVTAAEVFLKATVLKPVVHGLVHHESLATLIVDHVLGQTGFDRYKNLLARVFLDLAGIDLSALKRDGETKPLLEEVMALQKLRNGIIHQGQSCEKTDADRALAVTSALYSKVVLPMLEALGLEVEGKGIIRAAV